jgi:hypothetical protein
VLPLDFAKRVLAGATVFALFVLPPRLAVARPIAGALRGMPIPLTLPSTLITPSASLITPSASLVTPSASLVQPDGAPGAIPIPPSRVFAPVPAGAVSDRPQEGEKPLDYDTPRYEPAGFPIVGGTSDIGVMAGGVFTLTRFDGGVRPYRWNMDFVAAASAKGGSEGTEIVQQSYLWQWDVPGLMDGVLRLNPAVSYERTINQGYYGIGNATPVFSSNAPAGDLTRYNQFLAQEARVRELTRVKIGGPYSLMVATTYRYVRPEAYANSRLSQEAAENAAAGAAPIRGLGPMSHAQLGVGVVYDTRDNEFFPHRGMYHQVGVKVSQGMPFDEDVRYFEAGAILAGFAPIDEQTVVAGRLVADAQAGNVPFYDLSRGGPFMTYELIGGPQGVRGVPVGRYAGLVKVVANAEVRRMFGGFRAAGQSMHVGGDVFVDTGRTFADWSFRAASDGPGPGLKYGAGAGVFLQWGQAAIFRVDVAYSPDAVAENSSLPLGIYVQDGMMF